MQLIEPIKYINPLITLVLATVPTYFFTKAFTENVFITNDAKVSGACLI